MSKQTHTEFMIVLFLQDIPKMLHLLENHDIDLSLEDNQIYRELCAGRLTPSDTLTIIKSIQKNNKKGEEYYKKLFL